MKVLLKEYIHPDAEALLRQHVTVVEDVAEIEDVDAIILRSIPVDRSLIEKAKKLKVIGKHGVGCNTIDLQAAKDHNVLVFNTPTANTNAVAELIVGLILNCARNISRADAECRLDEVEVIAPASMTGVELTGKTLGLIGFGHIAQRVAEILREAFQLEALCYDPYISSEAVKLSGVKKYDTVKDVISRSDIVNVSVPLTPQTLNLVSGDIFDSFRPNAILINAARGGIVNEDDLYHALISKKLRAAACDAFVEEPPTSQNRLLSLDNFCATPHLGANTEEALYRMGMEVVEGVLDTLSGKTPAHLVVS